VRVEGFIAEAVIDDNVVAVTGEFAVDGFNDAITRCVDFRTDISGEIKRFCKSGGYAYRIRRPVGGVLYC
jgi:hypothetical protein